MATLQARLEALITAIGADIKTALTHVARTDNPHNTTKAQVGLGNVDNTSDISKPISTATQTALDGKAAVGHSHSMADIASLVSTLDQKTSSVQAFLSSTVSNSTVTPAVITSHTFTIPPGKTLSLQGTAVFRSAATTTGLAIGIRVAQGAGADSQARGNMSADVAISAVPAATELRGGGAFNQAAGTNLLQEVVGTGASSTTADHTARYQAAIRNTSTNANTTVTVEYRSEVAGSAVTLQPGTGVLGQIGL